MTAQSTVNRNVNFKSKLSTIGHWIGAILIITMVVHGFFIIINGPRTFEVKTWEETGVTNTNDQLYDKILDN